MRKPKLKRTEKPLAAEMTVIEDGSLSGWRVVDNIV
ncbi:hypothetical protein ES288_A13G209000v1 [Gossypium darwinii]|uniref:Uncharacterized protein n=1 Tax=Gossypium darwinii TaxID=34276 RepID=A0A5D2E2B3_GOSDA|nr:hypothetical protein ES288_A13G209000v1 [Gossypium darwinii]